MRLSIPQRLKSEGSLNLLIHKQSNKTEGEREKVCRDLEEGGLGFGITLTVSTMSPFSRFPGKLFTNPFLVFYCKIL